MNNIVLKYGLISGAILVAMVCTMMLMIGDSNNFERGELMGYAFFIAAFSMVFFGIREYRDKKQGGIINFNMAFRIGILITFMASVIYAIGWMLYFKFIDDSFIERYTSYMSEKIHAAGKSPAETEKELTAFKASIENYRNPLVMIMNTFLEVFPIGLIITVLCAMIMKRRGEEK